MFKNWTKVQDNEYCPEQFHTCEQVFAQISLEKNILNFHFDYLHPSLNRDKKMFKRAMEKLVRKDANTQKTSLG